LARYTLTTPPLRERIEDVPLLPPLPEKFLRGNGAATSLGQPRCDGGSPVLSFPGNVRELKNIIERALI